MNEVKNTLVTSINNYLYGLEYLARDNQKTLADIILLIIADEVYDWSNWYNAPQSEQLKLQNFRKSIIRNNPDIVDTVTRTNDYYKNVSLPQTIFTWHRVYDEVDSYAYDSFDFLLDQQGDILLDQQGNKLIAQ